MTIALIDYGAGNLASVRKALTFLGARFRTPDRPEQVLASTAVIIPGVGHFQSTAALDEPWRAAIAELAASGRAVLGICLGLQWLFEGSTEAPSLRGLGLFRGHCRPLATEGQRGIVKVPHVGWNVLEKQRPPSQLLRGIRDGAYVYFTHSYAPPVSDGCVAATTHADTFASAVERDRIYGVQFHPEKSGSVGLEILRNFLAQAKLAAGSRET